MVLLASLPRPPVGYLLLVAGALLGRTYADVWMISNTTAIESAIIDRESTLYMKNLLQYVYAMPAVSVVNNLLKNNRVERIWLEINKRVIYPVKQALYQLDQSAVVSKDTPTDLFAMSTVGQEVVKNGIDIVLRAWNQHPIPCNGIPNSFIPQAQNLPLPANILSTADTKALYEQQSGTQLTEEGVVGLDLLQDLPDKRVRRATEFGTFIAGLGGYKNIMAKTANIDYGPLQQAVQEFQRITENLSVV